MPAQSGYFRLFCSQTVVPGTPVTALQYAASSTNSAEIVSIMVSQSGVDLSDNEEVTIVRKSAGATVTAGTTGTGTSVSVVSLSKPNDPFKGTLSTSATGINATSEGTNANEMYRAAFSDLAGHQYAFLPDETIWVPPSGIIALRLEGKMASSATFLCQMVLKETS